jgi:hypothetical protein
MTVGLSMPLTYALAEQGCNHYIEAIEFRPIALASPLIARLTDVFLPRSST